MWRFYRLLTLLEGRRRMSATEVLGMAWRLISPKNIGT